MEEIRNAESLEKEIREDARKRADRVVRGREKALTELRSEWKKKTDDALAAMERAHAEEKSALERRSSAAVPLEQKRAFLQFAEKQLEEGVHAYFASLEPKRRDELLARRLGAAAEVLGESQVAVRHPGLTEEEAGRIVRKALPSVTPGGKPLPRTAAKSGAAETGAEAAPAVEITAAEAGIVVVSSTARMERELLGRHRERLARALLKGNVTP
ncbi:hypothetical protein [Salinispira pacifica]